MRLSLLVPFVLASLFLTACVKGNLSMESECEISMRPDGVLVQRIWTRDLRSIGYATNEMQDAFEGIARDFEPAIFGWTEKRKPGQPYLTRRELRTRGNLLDAYFEAEYPDGFSTEGSGWLLTNGCVLFPALRNEVNIQHNGKVLTDFSDDPDDTNVVFIAWPTNQSPIWYKMTTICETGAPLAWAYNAYLDAGRTFPWKTNEVTGKR